MNLQTALHRNGARNEGRDDFQKKEFTGSVHGESLCLQEGVAAEVHLKMLAECRNNLVLHFQVLFVQILILLKA